jgi:hypothetical protein
MGSWPKPNKDEGLIGRVDRVGREFTEFREDIETFERLSRRPVQVVKDDAVDYIGQNAGTVTVSGTSYALTGVPTLEINVPEGAEVEIRAQALLGLLHDTPSSQAQSLNLRVVRVTGSTIDKILCRDSATRGYDGGTPQYVPYTRIMLDKPPAGVRRYRVEARVTSTNLIGEIYGFVWQATIRPVRNR